MRCEHWALWAQLGQIVSFGKIDHYLSWLPRFLHHELPCSRYTMTKNSSIDRQLFSDETVYHGSWWASSNMLTLSLVEISNFFFQFPFSERNLLQFVFGIRRNREAQGSSESKWSQTWLRKWKWIPKKRLEVNKIFIWMKYLSSLITRVLRSSLFIRYAPF